MSEGNRRDQREKWEIWLIGAAVAVSSFPLFRSYLLGGHDTLFHLNRILGIEASLRNGMFPVRLNGYSLYGYGYADPVFYPNLFLYIPALFHMLELPFPVSVNLFRLLVNAATAAVMYSCCLGVFHSRQSACCSSIIYTLCTYRLCDLYTRDAYGEYLAMIFFPAVIYGFYELFFGDERRWVILTLGITGVAQSHILSLVIIAIACTAGGMICVRRILTKPRFRACLKMLTCTLCLNLWFLIPLLWYMRTEIDTSSLAHTAPYQSCIPAAKLLDIFAGARGGSPVPNSTLDSILPATFGLAMLCGVFLFLFIFIFSKRKRNIKAAVLFGTGILFAWMTTALFPWQLLSRIEPVRLFLSYLQFPWRFMAPASCMLSMSGAYAFTAFFGEGRKRLAAGSVLFLALVSSVYFIRDYMGQGPIIRSEEDVSPLIFQLEYAYPNSNRTILDGTFVITEDGMKLLNTKHGSLTAEFEYADATPGESCVDVPLFYYPGYHAVDSAGKEYPVLKGWNNYIRVSLQDTHGFVRVFFREPLIWRISEIVSLLSLTWLFSVLYPGLKKMMRRRKRKRF